MTLKGKLILNAVVVFVGIVLLVGVSLFGAIDTRRSIEQLARQSSPLQTQTLELMQRLEKTSSDLLRLGLVNNSADAERISGEVQKNLEAITTTAGEIEKLGNKNLGLDIKGLQSLHEQVKATVTRRLQDIRSFQQEAERVNEGLTAIDQSASQVGKGAEALNLGAGRAAEESRNIMAQSTNAIKKLLVLQTRYKAMELLFSDLDAIKSKYKLAPLKERVKALDDSVQAIAVDKDDPPVLAEAQGKFAEVSRMLVKDGGLMTLRTDALAAKDGSGDAAYQTQRSSLLQGFAGIDSKMVEAVDQKEIQMLKNRQRMETAFKQQTAALQLMSNASGINVDSKELNSGVRRIMLAAETAEVSKLSTEMSALRERINRQTELARAAAGSSELQRGLATVLQNLKAVGTAIDNIAQTKAQMLTSDKAMQAVFVNIRAITREQAQRGEQQVSAVKLSQENVLAQLTERASFMQSVLLIVGTVVSVLVLTMSTQIVRNITRQLGDLVSMVSTVSSTGNFSLRLAAGGQDEVGKTVQAFNHLMDSLQQAIDETNEVMAAVSAGHFSVRIHSEMRGDLARLKTAVNNSAAVMETAIDAVTHSMGAMSRGDFTQTVTVALDGQLAELKQAVNDSMGSVRVALSEVSAVMVAMAAGRFDQRICADMTGDLGALKNAVNRSAAEIQSALEAVAITMRAMAEGDFSRQVTTPLQGDLDTLKLAVNESLERVHSAIQEVNRLISALAAGDLDQRIKIKMSGELAHLKNNINHNSDSIRAALGEVSELLSAMAAGDLTRRANGSFPGAFGKLTAYANDAIGKLADTVQDIQSATQIIHDGTSDIAEGNQELSSRSEQQAASLEETAASMEELAQTVRQNNASAQEANLLAQQAAEVAEHGGAVVRQVVQTMGEVRDSSQKIVNITEIINSIAFQTNILSLNAAVEAARVGEHGKGFAVVAVEVRTLAQRCASAAEDIKRLIDESVQRISTGNQLAIEAGSRMDGIVASIKQVSIAVTDISNASSEQIQGIELVNKALIQLDEFTQRNAALVVKASEASELMQKETENLAQSVSLFQIS